jgi:hypothetical protein
MESASSEMSEGDGSEAERHQREAERRLKELQEELADEERRYEGIRQEELLFRIAKELATLIEGQGGVNTEARNVATKREASGGNLSRFDRKTLEDLHAKETELAEKGGFISKSIEKEGSDVYGFVMQSIAEDMQRLAVYFRDRETGESVQVLGSEILRRLQELAEGLKRERQQQNQGQQQQRQQGEQRRSLVPPDAELRMLRRLQDDLNVSIEDLQRDTEGATGFSPEQRREAERLAGLQGRLRDLWLRLAERYGLPTEEPHEAPKEGTPR